MLSFPPLNVVLISDAVPQAQQVRAAATAGTIAIVYHADTMTTNGMVDLLESVSTAHDGALIGDLGVVDHGAPGEIDLGTGDVLSLATLPTQTAALERLRSLLTCDAQIDLYSCSVAAGPTGKAFVNGLSAVTGAAVFASDDPFGTAKGANLILDYQTGQATPGDVLFSVQEMTAIQGLCLGTQSFGTALGSFNGVTDYSNGSPTYNSGSHNWATGINTGLEWQCVEYVQRYYYIQYGMNLLALSGGLDAWQFFGNAAKMQLTPYLNGGTTAPQVGDILCFNQTGTGLGHVAIVRSVDQANSVVHVIQQNVKDGDSSPNGFGTDDDFEFAYSVVGGTYTVDVTQTNAGGSRLGGSGATGGAYYCQGWLRGPAADTAPPTASLSAVTLPDLGQAAAVLTVKYQGTAAIRTSTIDNADILVTGPSGYGVFAVYPSVASNGDGTLVTATNGTVSRIVFCARMAR